MALAVYPIARRLSPPLLRRAEQPVWQDPATGYLRREVAPAGTGSPVRIVEVDFPGGAEVRFEKSQHRIIEQHVWMLKGEIEVALQPFGQVVTESPYAQVGTGLGLLWALFDRDRQFLHDRLAGTRVIKAEG